MDRLKPLVERQVAFLKDGADANRELLAAVLALPKAVTLDAFRVDATRLRAHALQAVVRRHALAVRANRAFRPQDRLDLGEGGGFIVEVGFAENGHGLSSCPSICRRSTWVCQLHNPRKYYRVVNVRPACTGFYGWSLGSRPWPSRASRRCRSMCRCRSRRACRNSFIVGLPDKAVKEVGERVHAALCRLGPQPAAQAHHREPRAGRPAQGGQPLRPADRARR